MRSAGSYANMFPSLWRFRYFARFSVSQRPRTSYVCAGSVLTVLQELHTRYSGLDQGEVATYIPELSHADPALFGIALVDLTGKQYAAGDADVSFTIQSVSKPFVFALALTDCGLDEVLRHVDVEPSGEAFNAISLEPGTGRPANPMINAGAIVTTSLILAENMDERWSRIRRLLSAFAGRDLEIDHKVYQSERITGDKNRALAYLMKNAGSLDADVTETLDLYFRQCSLLVTAEDIAVMAATLANRGVNPLTGQEVVTPLVAQQTMTVMATCGMYDHSGEWLLRVGLPAKSGVSGAVVAVRPGDFGVGLFSPPLDSQGNSVRAIAACRELSKRFDLHMMNVG